MILSEQEIADAIVKHVRVRLWPRTEAIGAEEAAQDIVDKVKRRVVWERKGIVRDRPDFDEPTVELEFDGYLSWFLITGELDQLADDQRIRMFAVLEEKQEA